MSRNADNSGSGRARRLKFMSAAGGPAPNSKIGSMAWNGVLWKQGVLNQNYTGGGGVGDGGGGDGGSGGSGSGLIRMLFTSGTGTWTAPSGVTTIEYLIVGGGGGGGGGVTTGAGGGGGGGSVKFGTLSVTPGTTYSYTVGAGGLGGTISSTSGWVATNGLAGADTVFGTITAKGGGFGYKNFENNSSGAIGRGGNAQSGDTPTTGGSGGQYRDNTTFDGGFTYQRFGAGGGGGGAGGAGVTSVTSNSDDTHGGLGGAGVSSDLQDGTARTYGAGGRGADEGTNSFITNNNGGTRNGANGAANTGKGGAGGSGSNSSGNGGTGGSGGSGIIVLKYTK